jgi:hypothetical protein
VRNATRVGVRLHVADGEPHGDLTKPFRTLQRPPLGVWVKPLEAPFPLGDTSGPYAPLDCMVIRPMQAKYTPATRSKRGQPITLPEGQRPVVANVQWKKVD